MPKHPIYSSVVYVACSLVAVMTTLGGCSPGPETSSYRVVDVLERTYDDAAQAKAETGVWPRQMSALALGEYATDRKDVVRVGGAYFLVSYRPKSQTVGPRILILLTRANKNGELPMLSRELYAIRTDGALEIRSGYDTSRVTDGAAVLLLAGALALPLALYWPRRKHLRNRE